MYFKVDISYRKLKLPNTCMQSNGKKDAYMYYSLIGYAIYTQVQITKSASPIKFKKGLPVCLTYTVHSTYTKSEMMTNEDSKSISYLKKKKSMTNS